MNIELYIANKLCDLEKSDLSIRLKRQFINPTELNTKDAQKSYTITLPSTPNNDKIFRYKNVEETDGKFSIYPDARLYVNGILILEGKFRLTEITRDSYKGNLGVPAPLSVKDVFGERKMNEIKEWTIKDWKGLESISTINKDSGTPDCIFPLVLYGLLTKEDIFGEGYSPKDIYDSQVKLRLDDMPPSINCVQLLKKMFESRDNKLTGAALEDERLKNLYVSYKNANDAQMDWAMDSIEYSLEGWKIYGIDNNKQPRIERNIYCMPEKNKRLMYINLFNLDNVNPAYGLGEEIIKDKYNNVRKDSSGGNKIIIPHSGLYKIKFKAYVELFQNTFQKPTTDGYERVGDKRIVHNSTFVRVPIEILLLKNREDDYEKYQFLNRYFVNNTPLNPDRDADIADFPKEEIVGGKAIGYPNFIDPLISKHLISGFSFGRKSGIYDADDRPEEIIENEVTQRSISPRADDPSWEEGPNDKYYLNHNSKGHCFPMIASGGYSWSAGYESGTDDRQYSVAHSPGYVDTNKQETKKFKIDLLKDKETKKPTETFTTTELDKDGNAGRKADGQIEQVVWLEKGDVLEVIELMLNENWKITPEGSLFPITKISIFSHSVSFDLAITPFKKDKSWIKVTDSGSGIDSEPMYWNDEPDFSQDSIDLKNFLPANVKMNDWIDNFCKAFNLKLSNPRKGEFSLEMKENTLDRKSNLIINLDEKADVQQRVNEPLNLPQKYEIGFTVDNSEEGYIKSKYLDEKGEEAYDSGGGIFETGNIETGVTTQKSNFSYNWFKRLYEDEEKTKELMQVPVISDKEAWEKSFDYREMMMKKYYDKAQRFWYRKGTQKLKSDYFESFDETTRERIFVDIALVSNAYEGEKPLTLDYEDKPNSILREYFMLLNNNKNYTVVECYLTPEEYNLLDKCYIKFNGDLYLVAEADGYDPIGKSKTKLKLLKKD